MRKFRKAATDSKITIGFVNAPTVRPKSLLKGSLLCPSNAVDISLVLRRKKHSIDFDSVLQGNTKMLLSLLSKCLRHN